MRSVQEKLEKALSQVANEPINVLCAGRTDAGVHGTGQVVHFETTAVRKHAAWTLGVNANLPGDIAVRWVKAVPDDFHARYLATGKTYEFRVDIGKPRSPFRRYYASYFPYPIDVQKIQQALPDLLGTHDFTSFCASGSSVEDHVRTIDEASLTVSPEGDELIFTFSGNGFLYKMIRILVGTLLKIGNDRMPVDAIPGIIAGKDRNLAGPTAHPEGLYLKEVRY